MLTADFALPLRQPWLYHVVSRADEGTRQTVASDGLVAGTSRRNWHPLYKPRVGHVYLATMAYTTAAKWSLWRPGDDMYAVNTRLLVPQRVNPDEDHFLDHYPHRQPALGMDAWTLFGSKVVPSFGDWAEQVDLGADERETAHSLSKGSVAYAGVVPPTALKRWDEAARAWTSRLTPCSG